MIYFKIKVEIIFLQNLNFNILIYGFMFVFNIIYI